MAGSWRRCPGRPGPSTPSCRGRAAPGRVSRLLPRPFPGRRRPRAGLETTVGPAGNETTPQAGTPAAGRANTRGWRPDRLREWGWEEGASYLSSLFLHTPHRRGAGPGGGSLHFVPTQITPHPHPRSRTHSGCPGASSPTPPAGMHLALRFPPPWGVSQVGGEQRECTPRGGQRAGPVGDPERSEL